VAATPSSVAVARELIASRLREIMRDADKTSRAIAFVAGWDESRSSGASSAARNACRYCEHRFH
jgi:hypothetical protein